MAFQYQAYRSPYAQSIADLLLRSGDSQAQGVLNAGNARAGAEQQRGAAWGGAAQSIGAALGAIPQQVQQQKRAAQQTESDALQLSEQKRAITARDAFASIIQNTPQLDEDGVSLYDVPAVAKQLAALGQDPGDAVKHLGGINEAFRAEKAAKLALVKRGAEGVIAAGNDPTLANHFLDQLEKNKTYSAEEIGQFRQFIAADPANVAKLTAMLVGKRDLKTAAPGSTLYDASTGATVSTVPDPKADAAAKQATARQTEVERHNKESERIAAVTAGRTEAAQKETARHNAAVEGLEGRKVDAQTSDKTDLTPEGLDAAALNYAKTGQLPPLGMGDKTTRKAIINRAAAMMPGLDIASARADYTANSGALTQLQKSRDAIGAFEQTALKNIDVFLDASAKIVDTGSPLLNMPLRMITAKVLGSSDQAAVDAARQVAVNEIAKITTNPNLSGQLSDAARKEVEGFNPRESTLKQSIAVMKLLKNDMQNRTSSLDDQIAGIKARIAKAGPKPSSDEVEWERDPKTGKPRKKGG